MWCRNHVNKFTLQEQTENLEDCGEAQEENGQG
jgi:hypothetical protein